MNRTACLLALGLVLGVSAAAPARADSFLAYTDQGIPAGSDIWTWCDAGQPCDMQDLQECGTPEGIRNLRTNTNIWAGWGVFLNIDAFNQPQPEDLSAYANGSMRFWVRTPYDLKVEFQCKVNGQTQTKTRFLTQHGWNGTNTWQQITIPISAFFAPQPVNAACLGAVISPFMSTIENLPFFNTFKVDNVTWHKSNAHAGASTVQVQGRQLLVNGEPFVLNGMAYAPISIGENFNGAYRDRPDRYLVDFPLIAASGANAVRIYSSFMTTAMLDAAWSEGLYVIPTFPVNTAQLACTAGKDAMRERMRETIVEWKDHPAILFWLIGNEVNRDLTGTDLCTNWYPQLDSMALAAHQAEGASFHPVATGNSDTVGLADICQPGCSDDTSLPNLDLWGVQVYRSCSFGTLFNEYAQKTDCARPLVLTEFGADAWDSRLAGGAGAESQTMQADCLETLLADADAALAVRNPSGVSAGQILFEWADEWWKAFPPDPPVPGFCTATDWFLHDTCKNWENFGYPDPAMNEEWWGITGLDAADPNVRNPRAAHARLNDSWYLGAVQDLHVVSHNKSTGDTALSYVPGAGSTEHTLYFGPLSAVSSYGYTGARSGLGAAGSGNVTLPSGSLFFVLVGRNNGAEGCYGKDSACVERPPYAGAGIPQTANRTCSVPQCP